MTYFAGPQINQINLHVHFSNTGSRATVSNDPHLTASEKDGKSQPKMLGKGGPAKQMQANLSKLESESCLRSPNLLENQGSKQTLNQSSSKALPTNN